MRTHISCWLVVLALIGAACSGTETTPSSSSPSASTTTRSSTSVASRTPPSLAPVSSIAVEDGISLAVAELFTDSIYRSITTYAVDSGRFVKTTGHAAFALIQTAQANHRGGHLEGPDFPVQLFIFSGTFQRHERGFGYPNDMPPVQPIVHTAFVALLYDGHPFETDVGDSTYDFATIGTRATDIDPERLSALVAKDRCRSTHAVSPNSP